MTHRRIAKAALKYSPAALGAGLVLAAASHANAGEGGGSHYVPGTRNDFLMGVFGPPGLYLRNDLWYYNYSMGVHPLGGKVAGAATQKVALDTAKLSYLSDFEIFGARYGASMALTYVLNGDIDGAAAVGSSTAFKGGGVQGLSDLYVAPLLLNWATDKQHFTLQGAFYAPTGGYDQDAKLNTGRNYWTLDFVGSYTYFDPSNGFEFSASAGYMYNFENPDTNYRTGDEVHIDWTIAQHLPNSMAVGLSGYMYAQVESDEGQLAGPYDGSDFRAWSWGLGPSFQFSVPLGDKKSLGVIAKALFDVESSDRLSGELYMLSLSYKF